MKYQWSLDAIYSSYESEQFKSDLEKLKNAGAVMSEFCKKTFCDYNDAKEKIEKYLSLYAEYNSLTFKLRSFSYLQTTTNSKDELSASYLGKVSKYRSELVAAQTAFENYIAKCENLDQLIFQSDILKEHEFFLKEIVQMSKYKLSEKEEILISKMKLTGSAAWAQLQGKVSSQAMAEIEEDGEKKIIPVTAIPQLPTTKDKAVKLARFHAETKAYEGYSQISAACLNNLKGEVITVAQLRGYSSPLQMTLNECRMDEQTLNALIASIEEYLPQLRRYYKIKGKLLGYEKGLPYYEITAPVGNSDKKYTIEQAEELVLKAFKGFSQELHDLAKEAFDNNWVDYEPREGKRSGAFCSGVHPIKQSRILTNFNGNIKDVNTLAHELGHAFHGRQLVDESILNTSYPMPLAETASTFCEQVLKAELLKTIGDDEKLSFIGFSILSAVAVTVDILSRYYFESEFMAKRADAQMSVSEINELMISAQKKSYGDGLDNDLLSPYMWLNKVHYYMPERNFYNFPYAFGLLFSLGLYSIYEQKGDEFINDYNTLLKATGKMNIAEVCALANIDVRSKDFWKRSLDQIVQMIDEFEKLAQKA